MRSQMKLLVTLLCTSVLLLAQSREEVKAVMRRGEALVTAGQLKEAEALYEHALQEFPGEPDLSLQLGLVHFRQQQLTKAIEDFNRTLHLRSQDIKALFYLAEAYFLSRNLDLARQTIARAAAITPDDAQVCEKYGEYLSATVETRAQGLEWLQKAKRLDPHLRRIDFEVGRTQFELTDFEAAGSSFETALKNDPEDGQAAFFLAEALGNLGDWDKAKNYSQYALAHGQTTGPAYYELGRAMVELGDSRSALEPLQHALALQPSLIQVYFQLAKAYRQLGRFEDARRESQLYAAMNNRIDTSHEFRTAAEEEAWRHVRPLLERHQEEEAIAYLAKLPAPAQYGAAYSHYLLGTMYFSMGWKAEAEPALLVARAQAPQAADIAAYLGLVQLSSGETAVAERNFVAALALDSSETLAQIGMGVVRYQEQRWGDAIHYLEQSRTADPATLLMLCDAYFRAGETDQALLMAQVIRALGAENRPLLTALDNLVKVHEIGSSSSAIPGDRDSSRR
jgi:tetratricopeptide (TPR) repeat protein